MLSIGLGKSVARAFIIMTHEMEADALFEFDRSTTFPMKLNRYAKKIDHRFSIKLHPASCIHQSIVVLNLRLR